MQIETFLDVLLIEEIPFKDEGITGLKGLDGKEIVTPAAEGRRKWARKSNTGKVISCDKQFPYNGMMIDMPYKVGDVVRTNEFGRTPIMLNPEDEFNPDAPKYYLIRYDDVQGRVNPVETLLPPNCVLVNAVEYVNA